MKINEWGVFVERPDGSTHEIILDDVLKSKVVKYINKLAENDENIRPDTQGKIEW
tara:strand:+ start:361 stop:525 length:165 start_codon:yes stop_codon:yes gene_type:complete